MLKPGQVPAAAGAAVRTDRRLAKQATGRQQPVEQLVNLVEQGRLTGLVRHFDTAAQRRPARPPNLT